MMYNTKRAMYQIILGINKDFMSHETKHHAADHTYVFTVNLESVQEAIIQKFATTKKTTTPGKSQPVLLLTTPSPKKTSTKIAVYVVNKDINQLIAIYVLKIHTRNLV
jgi:hypothetical protein